MGVCVFTRPKKRGEAFDFRSKSVYAPIIRGSPVAEVRAERGDGGQVREDNAERKKRQLIRVFRGELRAERRELRRRSRLPRECNEETTLGAREFRP